MPLTMHPLLLILLVAQVAADPIPGEIHILPDPAQHISFVWESLQQINNIIFPGNPRPMIYLVPYKVEKGTLQVVGGSTLLYTWQIDFRVAMCDEVPTSLDECTLESFESNIARRFTVTLRMNVERKKDWSAVPAMSDDQIQLWTDIEEINVELPGTSLYYYIPGEIFFARNDGPNKRKYTLSMFLSNCRKAKDVPTKANCKRASPADGVTNKPTRFFELTREEDRGAVHFVGYSAVETEEIVH